MPLDPNLRARIDGLVASERVVLFMKGVRGAPRCGFSSSVCEMLDQLLPDYATVDVLEDPALRDGIKSYSSWPTIPQLYVEGEFIGGSDIVQEMFADGSLHARLGVEAAEAAPEIRITDAAARALVRLAAEQPGRALHLSVDARYQNGLYFGPDDANALRATSNGVTLLLGRLSAARAKGLVIDTVETEGGPGFRIDNPNAPAPTVGQMSVQQLAELIASGERVAFYDVRTPDERALAHIEGARLLDPPAAAALEAGDKDALVVFHCHHGGRSQAAAQHFAALGLRNVWNVTGGIDAWSLEIDRAVPRY